MQECIFTRIYEYAVKLSNNRTKICFCYKEAAHLSRAQIRVQLNPKAPQKGNILGLGLCQFYFRYLHMGNTANRKQNPKWKTWGTGGLSFKDLLKSVRRGWCDRTVFLSMMFCSLPTDFCKHCCTSQWRFSCTLMYTRLNRKLACGRGRQPCAEAQRRWIASSFRGMNEVAEWLSRAVCM